jgi:hypothetical protein
LQGQGCGICRRQKAYELDRRSYHRRDLAGCYLPDSPVSVEFFPTACTLKRLPLEIRTMLE